jgi:hypothetical protein
MNFKPLLPLFLNKYCSGSVFKTEGVNCSSKFRKDYSKFLIKNMIFFTSKSTVQSMSANKSNIPMSNPLKNRNKTCKTDHDEKRIGSIPRGRGDVDSGLAGRGKARGPTSR